jgi:hypothetical protein
MDARESTMETRPSKTIAQDLKFSQALPARVGLLQHDACPTLDSPGNWQSSDYSTTSRRPGCPEPNLFPIVPRARAAVDRALDAVHHTEGLGNITVSSDIMNSKPLPPLPSEWSHAELTRLDFGLDSVPTHAKNSTFGPSDGSGSHYAPKQVNGLKLHHEFQQGLRDQHGSGSNWFQNNWENGKTPEIIVEQNRPDEASKKRLFQASRDKRTVRTTAQKGDPSIAYGWSFVADRIKARFRRAFGNDVRAETSESQLAPRQNEQQRRIAETRKTIRPSDAPNSRFGALHGTRPSSQKNTNHSELTKIPGPAQNQYRSLTRKWEQKNNPSSRHCSTTDLPEALADIEPGRNRSHGGRLRTMIAGKSGVRQLEEPEERCKMQGQAAQDRRAEAKSFGRKICEGFVEGSSEREASERESKRSDDGDNLIGFANTHTATITSTCPSPSRSSSAYTSCMITPTSGRRRISIDRSQLLTVNVTDEVIDRRNRDLKNKPKSCEAHRTHARVVGETAYVPADNQVGFPVEEHEALSQRPSTSVPFRIQSISNEVDIIDFAPGGLTDVALRRAHRAMHIWDLENAVLNRTIHTLRAIDTPKATLLEKSVGA